MAPHKTRYLSLSAITDFCFFFFFLKLVHLINCCFISLTPVTYIYLSLLALALKLNLAWIHREKNPAVCNQKWKIKIILTSTEFYINLKRGSIHIKQQNLKCAFCILSLSFSLSVSSYCSFMLSIYLVYLSIYLSCLSIYVSTIPEQLLSAFPRNSSNTATFYIPKDLLFPLLSLFFF